VQDRLVAVLREVLADAVLVTSGHFAPIRR